MIHPAIQLSVAFRKLLAGLAVLSFAFSLSAQVGDIYKGVKLLDYYDSTPGKIQTNQLKSQITGGEAQPQANGQVMVKKMRIENYLEDGRTNLIAVAPQCFIDYRSRVVSSPGPLEVETANGQLTIRGQGFFYLQTNFNLTISNQVETTIHRELIRSTNAASAPFPSLSKTNSQPATNELIEIFSDHFLLESPANLALYSGRVRVEDPQFELTSERLTIHRSTNESVESIVAEQDVVLTNKLEKSRATGDRAVYSLEPDKELMILTGREALWQEREREAKAGIFTFDRRANTLRAEQKPWMKLPRSTIAQPDWLTGRPTAPTNAVTLTNQFVEITAGEMMMQFPTTNHPARRLSAQTDVVIISPADKSRATSDQALYDETSGAFRLTGHATWQADQRLAKGDTLTFDLTNKTFSAQSNGYLRMPLSSLGGQAPQPSNPKQTAAQPETVEVFSDSYIYEAAGITFHEHVRAIYFQGELRRGSLACGFLNAGFNSNRLETLLAKDHVALEQPPTGTNLLRRVNRRLNCEMMTIHFDTNGLVRSVLAETNVLAHQTETRSGRPLPIESELTAERVSIGFFEHTNQIQQIVADKNVSIMQNPNHAHGDKAVYTASNNVVQLIGNPTADTPMGRITEAEVLVWDRTHNTVKAKGKKVAGEAEAPGKGTNFNRLLLRK